MKSPNPIGKWLPISSSFCIVVALFTGLYVALWPVDVLKDWKIRIVDQPMAYRPGSTIIVNSEYTKLRSVSGTA